MKTNQNHLHCLPVVTLAVAPFLHVAGRKWQADVVELDRTFAEEIHLPVW